MWDNLKPEQLAGASTTDLRHGTRVARRGTVSFTRSGFARVHWDDGCVTDEWAADLTVEAEDCVCGETSTRNCPEHQNAE